METKGSTMDTRNTRAIEEEAFSKWKNLNLFINQREPSVSTGERKESKPRSSKLLSVAILLFFKL